MQYPIQGACQCGQLTYNLEDSDMLKLKPANLAQDNIFEPAAHVWMRCFHSFLNKFWV
jgi:hypothetical protein